MGAAEQGESERAACLTRGTGSLPPEGGAARSDGTELAAGDACRRTAQTADPEASRRQHSPGLCCHTTRPALLFKNED